MNSPMFSVIIPVYNAAGTLEASVRSVLRQTLTDFEVLLLDDGSTDDSRSVMHRLAADDPRVRVIAFDNHGVAATRNLGVELAHGDLIAFLDADDVWCRWKLFVHRAHHLRDDAPDATFARIAFVSSGQAFESTQSTVPKGRLTVEQLVGENPVCTMSNLVVSRAAWSRVGGFDGRITHAEDQEWLIRAVSAGCRIEGIDRLLVDYRTSPAGLSSDLRRMHASWRRVARRYRDQVDMSAAEAIYCRYLARRALRVGAPAIKALRYVIAGLSFDSAAFFSDRRRGLLTATGALAGLVLPTALRTRFFA